MLQMSKAVLWWILVFIQLFAVHKQYPISRAHEKAFVRTMVGLNFGVMDIHPTLTQILEPGLGRRTALFSSWSHNVLYNALSYFQGGRFVSFYEYTKRHQGSSCYSKVFLLHAEQLDALFTLQVKNDIGRDINPFLKKSGAERRTLSWGVAFLSPKKFYFFSSPHARWRIDRIYSSKQSELYVQISYFKSLRTSHSHLL